MTRRGMDPRLDAIVLKSLAKAPADRYATAMEFAADVERYLANEPVLAMSKESRAPRPWWAGRASVAVVLVVTMGLAVFGAWGRGWVKVNGSTWQATHPAEIPPDAFRLRGHAYAAFRGEYTWNAAVAKAAEMGGHLMVITDQAEQTFLSELLDFARGGTSHRAFWLGMESDSIERHHTVTGEPLNFFHWSPRPGAQPSGQIGPVATTGHYWFVAHRDQMMNFVVEWPDAPPPTLSPGPPDAHLYRDSRTGQTRLIKLIDQPMLWHVARRACRELGGELVCIDSAEKEAFLLSLPELQATSAEPWIGGRYYGESFAWVDGTDAGQYANFVRTDRNLVNERVYLTPAGWKATTPIQRIEPRPFLCEWSAAE